MCGVITASYPVVMGDYERAGEASADIKNKLKKLGIAGDVLRRVAVASYEVEMNMIIHSLGGQLTLRVDQTAIWLTSRDQGPGIPDLALAMREGYSTADDQARDLGFGAGMGLPNMKRNTDFFDIKSQEGSGTTIQMRFDMKEQAQ